MSFTIESGKELSNPGRPLILCTIVCTDGNTEYLGSAAELGHDYLTYNGNQYLCRVAGQTIDAIQTMSAQGYDIPGSVALTINDGDLYLWTKAFLRIRGEGRLWRLRCFSGMRLSQRSRPTLTSGPLFSESRSSTPVAR